MFTVITMYRGYDAEILTQIVAGRLTPEQRQAWRDAHNCDTHTEDDDADQNNMFFREFDTPIAVGQIADLINVDGP